MKLFVRRVTLGTLLVALFAHMACDERRASGNDDDDGAGGSGADPSMSATGGGPSCKDGGAPCESFEECCSNVCANQQCTVPECGEEYDSCDKVACCPGLECHPVLLMCEPPCAWDAPCSLASDCCSNVCDGGWCAEPETDCNVGGTCQACIDGPCGKFNCDQFGNAYSLCNERPGCRALVECWLACDSHACTDSCSSTYAEEYSLAQSWAQCFCGGSDVCAGDCACYYLPVL